MSINLFELNEEKYKIESCNLIWLLQFQKCLIQFNIIIQFTGKEVKQISEDFQSQILYN